MEKFKFILAETVIIVALLIGFFAGRSIDNRHHDFKNYHKDADRLWRKVQKLNDMSTGAVESTEVKLIAKIETLYREISERYRSSDYAAEATYHLATRFARSQEEQFNLFWRIVNNYPHCQWADDALYAIAMAHYRIAKDENKTNDFYHKHAIKTYDRLLLDYPESELINETNFNRAICYHELGDRHRALSELRSLRESATVNDSISDRATYQMGVILSDEKNYRSARKEFLKVAENWESSLASLAQFAVAQTYFSEENFDRAIAAYEEVIDRYGGSSPAEDAHFYIGWAYEKLRNYDKALEVLRSAIDKFPGNENRKSSKFFVAQIFRESGKLEESIEVYGEISRDVEFDYDLRRSAQFRVGEIFEEMGKTEEAISAYDELLRRFPEPHQNPGHPSNLIAK